MLRDNLTNSVPQSYPFQYCSKSSIPKTLLSSRQTLSAVSPIKINKHVTYFQNLMTRSAWDKYFYFKREKEASGKE
jgi:hypothetical protein